MVIGLLPSTVLAAETTGVAEVGGKKYNTLTEAINAAGGGTITLLADIEITEETTFNMVNGTVLDLNDKTIKADDGKAIFAGTAFTIKNGTVTGFNGTDYYAITIDSASTKALRSASNIVLEDLTFTDTGLKVRGGATVTLKDNTITANQSKFKYAVWAYGSANVTIESGSYFGGKNGYDVFAEGNAKIALYGGTYKVSNNKTYMAKDAELVYSENSDGTFAVKTPNYVAQAGDTKYESLQDAISAAGESATITLLADVTTESVAYALPTGATLDLNSKTLTTTGATFTGSNITIKNGKIALPAGNSDHYILFIGSQTGDKVTATLSGVETTAGIQTINADVTMENVIAKGGNNKSRYAVAAFLNSQVNIKNGNFTSHANAKRDLSVDDTSKITVSGGTYSKEVPASYLAEGYISTKESGKYIVREGKQVAEVNSIKYETLKAAIEAAPKYYTVKLLADVATESVEYAIPTGVTLDLNDYTLTVDYGKFITGDSIKITNGTIKCSDEGKEYALFIGTGSSATVTNVTVNGGIYVNGAKVTLEDVTATAKGKRHAVVALEGADVTINSGTYTATTNTGSKVANADQTSTIAINGGKFSKEPAASYMADGKFAVYEDGWYVISANQAVAEVNGKKYESLQDAINAAPTYYTVTLLANIEATEQIVINKSITLDLDEFTITGNSEDAIVRIYSAEVDKKIDVTIEATTGGIVNTGIGYAIYAGEDLDGGNDAERTNLTINGGNYETAGTDCIKQIMGRCTINCGSYKSSYGRTVLNGERWYGAEFTINGGSFYGFNPACVSVWTGFDGKDYTNFYHQHDIIAEGKTAEFNDGWYTVVDSNYTAKVETKSLCYPSLAAALYASINLDDVANLGVITLLDDDTIDLNKATITLPDGLTIDLNGKTLTVPFQKTLFAGNNITIKNGTITTGSTENYGLYIMGGSFTLENLTLTNGLNVQAGTVTLEDCDVTCPNKYYAVYAGANADVTILSGSYNTVRNAKNLYADGKITVYGGTFNKRPEAKHLAEDRHVVKSGSVYTVYEGFKAALAAAEDGDTVYLMSDIEVAETISIEKSITLDLGESTITSTAAKNVIYSTADLTIDATTGGIYSETAYVAVGQDNGVCTINGGSFKASGDTGDYANGQPVYNTLVLNNSDFYEGVTGSFVINGGKFYGFNPACMSVNKHDHHDHDNMGAGLIATLDAEGWFTVTEGEFKYMVVCDCSAPASAHQHCFATVAEAQQYIEMMGNCKFDKIVDMNGNAVEGESTDTDNEFDGFGGLF